MVDVEAVRSVAEFVILGIALFGNLLMWFEADWATGASNSVPKPDSLFGLFVACLILCIGGTKVCPPTYKVTIRTIGLFFFMNFVEASICATRQYFTPNQNSQVTGEQYRTMRTGALLAMMAYFVLFVERLVVPIGKTIQEAVVPREIKSVRGVAFMVAGFFFFVAQGVTWGIKDVCSPANHPEGVLRLNVSPLLITLFLWLGVIFNDTELLDIALFKCIMGLNEYRTIFNHAKPFTQDNYKHLWRAQMSFGFMACLIVVFVQLVHSVRFSRSAAEREATIGSRIKSVRMAFVAFLWCVGVAGAACVYSRSPKKGDTANFKDAEYAWVATFAGFVIPTWCVIAWFARCQGAAVMAFLFANFTIAHFCSNLYGSTLSGYKRGGAILCVIASFFPPLLVLSEHVGVPENVEVYFEGDNKVPMVLTMLLGFSSVLWWDATTNAYLTTFAGSVLLFFGASTGSNSMFKVVLFLLLGAVTGPSMWPLSNSFSASVPITYSTLVFWCVVGYIAFHFPGLKFDCFHEHEDYEALAAASSPLTKKGAGEEDAEYKPVGSEERLKEDEVVKAPATDVPQDNI